MTGAAPANFSRDLRFASKTIAIALMGLALAILALLGLALADARALEQAAAGVEARIVQLERELGPAREAASGAPAILVFTQLSQRISALNTLDHAGTPGSGMLFGVLEATLPDNTVLTNVDYDRSKGVADLVAVSARSEELTQLFDRLDADPAFAKVRLLDKKQIATAGSAHTQVNLVLEIARPSGAGNAERKNKPATTIDKSGDAP